MLYAYIYIFIYVFLYIMGRDGRAAPGGTVARDPPPPRSRLTVHLRISGTPWGWYAPGAYAAAEQIWFQKTYISFGVFLIQKTCCLTKK